MTKLIGLLSILLATPNANAAPASMIDIPGWTLPNTVLIAGHDSVGALLPLPLWPPYTPRANAPAAQGRKHKLGKCAVHACPH